MGDSFYEYLLKIWVQSNFKSSEFRLWYEESVEGMIQHLLKETMPSRLRFLADWNPQSNAVNRKMDHLVCFAPGMLALGAYHSDKSPGGTVNKDRDLKIAKQLMYTCVQMYLRQASGMSAFYEYEEVVLCPFSRRSVS